jgi:hypothetical protein
MGGVLLGVFEAPAALLEPELPVYDYEDTEGGEGCNCTVLYCAKLY